MEVSCQATIPCAPLAAWTWGSPGVCISSMQGILSAAARWFGVLVQRSVLHCLLSVDVWTHVGLATGMILTASTHMMWAYSSKNIADCTKLPFCPPLVSDVVATSKGLQPLQPLLSAPSEEFCHKHCPLLFGEGEDFVSHFSLFWKKKKKKVQLMQFLAEASSDPWTVSTLRDLGKTGVNSPTSFPVVLWEEKLRG